MMETAAYTITRVPPRTRQEGLRHRRMMRRVEFGLAVGIPAFLIALWQVAVKAEWINPVLYPAPSEIAREGWRILTDGRLRNDIAQTTKRVLIGFAIGSSIGFIAGLTMGVSHIVRKALEPMLNALYVVPKLALLPVILTIFGFGEAPKIAIVATTVFFFVWIQTMEAVVAVPDGFRESAQSLGMSRWQTFRHALLPAALPQLFVGLRIAMGVAVLVIIGVEFLIGKDGLGNLIFISRQLFINEWVYVGMATIAIEGVILTWIIERIGRRVTPWIPKEGRSTRATL